MGILNFNEQQNNNNMKETNQAVNVNDISRISLGTTFKGELYSPNDIRIDGNFEGKVFSEGRIVVGEQAKIKGDLICTNVDFWGKMEGNFFVKETLSLKDACSVDGDLHVRRLQVELDAKFNGSCRMITEEDYDKLTVDMLSITNPSATRKAVVDTKDKK